MDVLERYFSGDMLWCLLVPSLDAQSDRVRVSIEEMEHIKVVVAPKTIGRSSTRLRGVPIHTSRKWLARSYLDQRTRTVLFDTSRPQNPKLGPPAGALSSKLALPQTLESCCLNIETTYQLNM